MPPRKQASPSFEDLRIEAVTLRLRGDSPLICHAWSQKARQQMLAKQMDQGTRRRETRDPLRDYADSLYWISERPEALSLESIAEGRFGFPTIGFKSAAVDACSHIAGITKVEARGAFHIPGELVGIEGQPRMREDVCRIGMGVADLRFRGEFETWAATLTLRVNLNVISVDRLVRLFDTAGFAIGIGEWRPQKDGSNGMFHVEQVGELQRTGGRWAQAVAS